MRKKKKLKQSRIPQTTLLIRRNAKQSINPEVESATDHILEDILEAIGKRFETRTLPEKNQISSS